MNADTELEDNATQQAEALSVVVDVLMTALYEQAETKQLCPKCLFQNLASTLLLNVGLKFLHDGQAEAWLSGVGDILDSLRLAHSAAPGNVH